MHSLSQDCAGKAEERRPVDCPFCGRASPVWAEKLAQASGLWVKCKNPKCRKIFEIRR